ncbi:MAG: cellulose binding domain-containing protein, partial [Myxococcota bacterium]
DTIVDPEPILNPEEPDPNDTPDNPPDNPDNPNDPPPSSDGLTVEIIEQSRWPTGYCADVNVTNTTNADITWTINLDIQGSISDMWNAERDGDSGRITVRGVSWNSSLGSGQTASFGFCANI